MPELTIADIARSLKPVPPKLGVGLVDACSDRPVMPADSNSTIEPPGRRCRHPPVAAAALPPHVPADLAQRRHAVVQAHRAERRIVAGPQRDALSAEVRVGAQLPRAALRTITDDARVVEVPDAREIV